MVKRSVIALRKVLAAVVVRDVSPILQLGGVGIVTIKDTSLVILSMLLALITAAMTCPYTLYYLKVIDTIALVQ